jgi:hypothetical protein
MAQGDLISRAKMQSAYGTGWTTSNEYGSPNNTYWVAAPVFVARLYTNASGFASNKGSCTVYKWNGSSFVQVASGSTKGGFGASNNQWRFIHNCNESYNAHDDSNVHLFKFVVSSSGGGTKTMSFWCGGVHCSANNNANTYKTGNLICGIKPDYWANGGTYSSDSAFVNGQKREAWRGTPISASNSYMCFTEG